MWHAAGRRPGSAGANSMSAAPGRLDSCWGSVAELPMIGCQGLSDRSITQEVDVRTRFASLSLLVLVVALALTVAGCSKDKAPSARLGLDEDGKPSALSAATESASGGANETTDSPKKPSATSPASGGSQTGGQSGASSGGSSSGGNSGGSTSGGSSSGDDGASDPKTPAAAGKTIRILWWNDTVDKPVASPEIVFGGKSYRPKAGKSDVGSIGPAKPGSELTFSVYPDGRSGKSVSVRFEVTDEMLSNSDIDAIHVEVSDAQVRVLGNPIPNFVQAFKR